MFVTGHSAGAYIAAMLVLDPRWLAAAGEDRAHLAGMVGLAGPYDFLPIQDEDIRAVFSAAADLRQTQPVAHVDGRNPPMLLLHGAADTTCYPRNTLALAARVRAAAGVVERAPLPGGGTYRNRDRNGAGVPLPRPGLPGFFRLCPGYGCPRHQSPPGACRAIDCGPVIVRVFALSATGPTLVTGGTGFVGSAVARAFAARGHALRLLARRGSDRRNIAGLDAETVEGDLTDPASLARAVAGCRFVVHVAADYRIWVPDPQAMLAANVEGTRALMRAALQAGVERVVYCSSVAALGLTGDATPADERTAGDPVENHRNV